MAIPLCRSDPCTEVVDATAKREAIAGVERLLSRTAEGEIERGQSEAGRRRYGRADHAIHPGIPRPQGPAR